MWMIIILLSMLFCHIVDDYYLQGWLAQAKQKSWWEKNAPNEMYRNDYKVALIEHAFSWTFMIHVPVIIAEYCLGFTKMQYIFVPVFIFNWITHCMVDNLKANKKKINLIEDQIIHIIQVIMTWWVYI